MDILMRFWSTSLPERRYRLARWLLQPHFCFASNKALETGACDAVDSLIPVPPPLSASEVLTEEIKDSGRSHPQSYQIDGRGQNCWPEMGHVLACAFGQIFPLTSVEALLAVNTHHFC